MDITKGVARLRRLLQPVRMSDQPITKCPLCKRPWSQCICTP